MPLNQAELDEMRAEREAMKEDPKVTLRAMVTTSSLRRPLVIAVMMMMAQQLSGINAAFFFSTSIFKSAGMEEGTAQVSQVSSTYLLESASASESCTWCVPCIGHGHSF